MQNTKGYEIKRLFNSEQSFIFPLNKPGDDRRLMVGPAFSLNVHRTQVLLRCDGLAGSSCGH